MADYSKMLIKTYDDFLNKSNEQITQCTSNKVARDFGIDFGIFLDFCDEIRDLQTCLNTEDTEGLSPAVTNTLNNLLTAVVTKYEDSIDQVFEAWNSTPTNLNDACSILNANQPFFDGWSSAIGGGYSNTYSIIASEFNKLTFESITTEVTDTLSALAQDIVCNAINDGINCMKEKLLSIPWDCLSVVDASNLEALRTFDAEEMCNNIADQLVSGQIASKVGMTRLNLQSKLESLKSFSSVLMNTATTSVNNIASLGSAVANGQVTASSCRDIANAVDKVVNGSATGVTVAIAQAIYRDFRFLSEIDVNQLADDLFDCMEIDDDLFDLCNIGEKILDISNLLNDFTHAMFTDLDKLCELVTRLDNKLNDRLSTRNTLEFLDDRHIPLRNHKTVSAMNFILDVEEYLNDSTYKQFNDWANNLDTPECVDMPGLIDEMLPICRVDYFSEQKVGQLSNIYYEKLKCLYHPIDYENFIDNTNDSLTELIVSITTIERDC